MQNAATGDSLNKARISVEGSNTLAFTDESGRYRLVNMPVGDVKLRVYFTGLDPIEETVMVTGGETVVQNFTLSSQDRYGQLDEVFELDAFTVEAQKETNAAAISVNEQRFAAGQMSVVSADQFGTIPDTNPGELMKWLPGVTVEYFANNIVGVSVRGLDAANTEIMFDGMPVASASTTSNDRNFEMLGSSSADIARVEVRKLRTPADSANALGGSINLVRRSAFEAEKRKLTYNMFFTSHSEEFSLSKRDGIRDTQMQGWRPNFKLTWTDPVSDKFGYAVTLAHSDVLARVHWSAPSVDFGSTTDAEIAEERLAAGLPLTTRSVYNPRRNRDLLHDNPKHDVTDSGSIKFDWRPTEDLKLSYSLSASEYQERTGDELRFIWDAGSSGSDRDAALGEPGTNGEFASYGRLGVGKIGFDMREAWRNGIKNVMTHQMESEWRHGDWTVKGGASYSSSEHEYRDTEDGFFQSTTMVGSTIPNSGIGTGMANPQRITVDLLDRDFTFSHTVNAYLNNAGDTEKGEPVDWQDLSNMYIGGAVSRPGQANETVSAVRLFAKHDFGMENPFSIGLGFDYSKQVRDVSQYDARLWTFVGADGVAQTADDSLAQIAAVNVQPASDTIYNSPAVPRISLRRLYDLYLSNPEYFDYKEEESHRFSTISPYELREETTAGYIEFSGSFLRNRLGYIGGFRYEKAEATGLGALDRGSAYVEGLGLDPSTLEGTMARYVAKGAKGKGENDGIFPSLELNYNFTDRLILRAGYAKTQAKNRFRRSVIPSTSIDYTPVDPSDVEEGEEVPLGKINRPNPSLQPWTADNFEVHLEYYTQQGGVLSAGGFVKNIENVQVRESVYLGTAEQLAELDLEEEFLGFLSSTWVNKGEGKISGLEFEVRQPMDRILPEFAKGFVVTGSVNYNKLSKFVFLQDASTSNGSTDFSNFYETQHKVSFAYHRGRVAGTLGLIKNGKVYRQRQDVGNSETGTGAFIHGDRFYPPYTTVDFSFEYKLSKPLKLFFSGRNITDAQKERWRVLEGAPDWSNFQIANNLGVTYTVGLSGSF